MILLGIVILLMCILVFVIKTLMFRLEPWEPLSESKIKENLTRPERPNILFLVAEDMSSRVGAFGDKVTQTPNIDRLSMKGVRYPNAFTTAGVCSPSRAALITGVHQISTGTQHMRTSGFPGGGYKSVPPSEIKGFPELLRKAGYYTFNTTKLDYQFSGGLSRSGPFTIWDAEDDRSLWRNKGENQPFFGMINIMETHETGLLPTLGKMPQSPLHFVNQIVRASGVLRKGEPIKPGVVDVPPYFPDTPAMRSDIAKHYQNINAMDAIVGDVLAKLEQDGLLQSTIVIWTTDHGDCLPRAKRELYDTGIKVPMVIYWPDGFKKPDNFTAGSVDNKLISFVDFAPTFLSIAKAPIPDYTHGINFFSDSVRSFIYASRDRIDEVEDRQRAIRNKRFKYIKSWYPEQPGGHRLKFRDHLKSMQELWYLKEQNMLDSLQLIWFEKPGRERLFDIVNDPFELQDLSTKDAYKGTLDTMRLELQNWLEKVEDWSEVQEKEMKEQFMPGGKQKVTAAPKITIANGMVTIIALDKGASIGYQVNNGHWKIYSQPFKVDKGIEISSKAVRYGWKESKIVKTNY